MKMWDEVLKGDIEAIEQIENLLRSEEYNANNPIIDIEKLALDVFNFESAECPKLEKIRKSSMTVRKKRLILFNPIISEQEKRICIAKQLAHIYYASRGNKSNIDLLARSFLFPKYIYNELKNENISEREILERIGFKGNSFMKKSFEYFKEPAHISKPIKSSITQHMKSVIEFLTSDFEIEGNKNVQSNWTL